MAIKNRDLSAFNSSYLFVEIANRRANFLASNPAAQLINLGIGDTTEPLPTHIAEAMAAKALDLGTIEGYTGYGDPYGIPALRESIANKIYKGLVSREEVYISDGAKCDVGRLQHLFDRSSTIAVQTPSYPVYAATSLMTGKERVIEMRCTPENAFFCPPDKMERTDIIYLCSPNNPTGAVLTHKQLSMLVEAAEERGSLIIFDSAYSSFIQDPSLPRSIYEVEGARRVAIETGSFSKMAGFTGVRLGWTVVPEELCFSDASKVANSWKRVVSTFFNGASNIAQAGGLAALSDEGQAHSKQCCDYYMENGRILASALEELGLTIYGGCNAPYLWADIKKRSSWDLFQTLMEELHLIVTPGEGFGNDGFLRLSSFGKREAIITAAARLTNSYSTVTDFAKLRG